MDKGERQGRSGDLRGEEGGQEVRIALVQKAEMRLLKKRHFGISRPTDVLSFPDEGGGDIAICPELVWQDAARDRREPGAYLAEVFLHGLLHLRGLRHGYGKRELEKLWARQQALLLAAKVRTRVFHVQGGR